MHIFETLIFHQISIEFSNEIPERTAEKVDKSFFPYFREKKGMKIPKMLFLEVYKVFYFV